MVNGETMSESERESEIDIGWGRLCVRVRERKERLSLPQKQQR